MDELTLLKQLETVKAPPDFELRLMARLSLERRARRRFRPAFGFSLAGAFASLLVVFVALNTFVLRDRPPDASARAEDGRDAGQRLIPVIETFDYAAEVRGRASGAGTVYLLEQISDTIPTGVTY